MIEDEEDEEDDEGEESKEDKEAKDYWMPCIDGEWSGLFQ